MKMSNILINNHIARTVSIALCSFTLFACSQNSDEAPNNASTQKTSTPITRTAILSGAQQTGVVTNATGYGTVVVDPGTRKITGGIDFVGITASAAHIHIGAAGASGAPAVTLTVNNATHSASIPDGTVLTPEQYDDLLAGDLYYNVHSSTNPAGEIRGQIGRVVMNATLNGDQNVPVVTTAATGTATVVVDPDTLAISGGVTFTGVTATASHIHAGAVGSNGGPVISLTVDNVAGTATIPADSKLTQEQYSDLLAGNLYVNVHSAANAGGEIRGQIGPVVMLAMLDGASNVPAVTTTANGRAVFVINPVTRALSGGVDFAELSASASHIHTGAVGVNGAPVVTLVVDNNTNTASVPENTVLTQAQYDSLISGGLYINVHSTTYTAGEIRGQLGKL